MTLLPSDLFFPVKDCIKISQVSHPQQEEDESTPDGKKTNNTPTPYAQKENNYHLYENAIRFEVDKSTGNGSKSEEEDDDEESSTVSIIGKRPIHPSTGIFYYEVTFFSTAAPISSDATVDDNNDDASNINRMPSTFGGFSIGVSNASLRTDQLPGEHRYSYGFSPLLRRIHCGGRSTDSYGEKLTALTPGTKIGCLINFFENSISYTVNGKSHGPAFKGIHIHHRCSASASSVKLTSLHMALGLEKITPGACFEVRTTSGEHIAQTKKTKNCSRREDSYFAFNIEDYVRQFIMNHCTKPLKNKVSASQQQQKVVETSDSWNLPVSNPKRDVKSLVMAHLAKRGLHKTLATVVGKASTENLNSVEVQEERGPEPDSGPNSASRVEQLDEQQQSKDQHQLLVAITKQLSEIRQAILLGEGDRCFHRSDGHTTQTPSSMTIVKDLILELDVRFFERFPRVAYLLEVHGLMEKVFAVLSTNGRKSQALAASTLHQVTALLYFDPIITTPSDEESDASPLDGGESSAIRQYELPVPYKERSHHVRLLSTVLLTWKNTLVDGSGFGADVIVPLRQVLWMRVQRALLESLPEFSLLVSPAEVAVFSRRCTALLQENSQTELAISKLSSEVNRISTRENEAVGVAALPTFSFNAPFLRKIWIAYNATDDG